MKNLLVAIAVCMFAFVLGGCVSSAPVEYVEVEPGMVLRIETPHKKGHAPGEDLSKTITHTVTKMMPDGTMKVVEEIKDSTVMTATMAEHDLKMAKIQAPTPEPTRQRKVEEGDICVSKLAPPSCFDSNRVSGYNAHYYTGGVSYAPQPYRPPPPVERPAGYNVKASSGGN
jgi:hypothetical protein